MTSMEHGETPREGVSPQREPPGVAFLILGSPHGTIRLVGGAVARTMGLTEEPRVGARLGDYLMPYSGQRVEAVLDGVASREYQETARVVVRTIGARDVTAVIQGYASADGQTLVAMLLTPAPQTWACPSPDPESERPRARLEHLTRPVFTERMERSLELHKGRAIALIYLDVDGLRFINASEERSCGDRLLASIGERLATSVDRERASLPSTVNCEAARVGGGDFALMVFGLDNLTATARLAERLQDALSQPYRVAAPQTNVTVTVAVCVELEQVGSAAEVLARADLALHEAKRTGPSRIVVFDAILAERLDYEGRIRAKLRLALAGQELRPVFRRIVELRTRRMLGVEALAGWDGSPGTVMDPHDAFPLVDDRGLAEELEHFLLHAACAAFATWQWSSPAICPGFICVRISGSTWQRLARLTAQLEAALRTSRIDPGCLILEARHEELLADARGTEALFTLVRKLGIRLAVGGFGSGALTTRLIRRIPFDYVRLHGTLAREVAEQPKLLPAVRGLIGCLAQCGVPSVVDGVGGWEAFALFGEATCVIPQNETFGPDALATLDPA